MGAAAVDFKGVRCLQRTEKQTWDGTPEAYVILLISVTPNIRNKKTDWKSACLYGYHVAVILNDASAKIQMVPT